MAVVSIQRSEQFVTEACCRCGVVFAVSADLQAHWRRSQESFYCPNGHSQAYVEDEVTRVKREMQKQIDAARVEAENAKRDIEWWRVHNNEKRRQLSAAKGQMTKLKKRIGHGVCPCCHRTFKQLAAHMSHMHPEFTSDADAVARVAGDSPV